MPSVSVSVEFPASASTIYQYLRNRYDSETYKSASRQAIGYIPPVARLEDVPDARLRFTVSDDSLGVSINAWTWTYDVQAAGDRTRVTIEYTWSWVLSVLSLWTVRRQAANEIVETVMALEGLDQSNR